MDPRQEDFLKDFYSSSIKTPDLTEKIMSKIENKKNRRFNFLKIELASFLAALVFGVGIFFLTGDEELMETNISFYNSIDKEVKKVEVMGDFTNWKKEKMVFRNGKWDYKLKVKPNTLYKYVFLIDGKIQDQKKKGKIKGYFNKFNRVLMVFKNDEGAKK